MKPREQGDWGEKQAAVWMLGQGWTVALPFGHTPDWDLIAEVDGDLLRVQVKTTRRFQNGRWTTMLCTKGGNQSWGGVIKRMDPSRCDYLFVAVADGRRWFIPAEAIGGGVGINLGGPKYAKFEVEPGPAMPSATSSRLGSRLPR